MWQLRVEGAIRWCWRVVFARPSGKIWDKGCEIEVLSVTGASCGIVFVSRRVVSEWSFKDGRSERDDVLPTHTHTSERTGQVSHLALERK